MMTSPHEHRLAEPIPTAVMAAHIDAGEAKPLLHGAFAGPTRYDDRWWHPADDAATCYELVTDPDQLEVLDDSAARLAAAREDA